MDKRETILRIAHDRCPGDFIPAAFFLHFPTEFHRGRQAVDKHLEYLHATDNDILKIQYEHNFPRRPALKRPADWASVPCYDEEFYADQIEVVSGVVQAAKARVPVIVTLYSAYMFAMHLVGWDELDRQMQEDPALVSKGLEIITESMLIFIRACMKRGVDGFYVSTQGGEAGRFEDPSVFDRFIRPLEMRIWDEIKDVCVLNVLHVCDYERPYESIESFAAYPGHIVSAPTHLAGGELSGRQVSEMFNRPFLGGMQRLGPLSTGPVEAIEQEVANALRGAAPTMILGADCTLAADASWEGIRAATSAAHGRSPAD